MYRLDLNKLQTAVWSIFARDSKAYRTLVTAEGDEANNQKRGADCDERSPATKPDCHERNTDGDKWITCTTNSSHEVPFN